MEPLLNEPTLKEAMALVKNPGGRLVSIHDPVGVYREASQTAVDVVGWTAEELVGRSAYAFFHTEDLGDIEAAHLDNLTRAEPEPLRYRFRCKDGYRWVETRSSGIVGPDDLGLCITRLCEAP